MTKACVICGGDETTGEQLLEAPCQRHWVCTDDVASFFERATASESLYPPKCCGQLFLLDAYEAHVPFDVSWAFQLKEQGEYSVLPKYRVYCANPACSKFLSPASHTRDTRTGISYAICQDEACGTLTCTTCKSLLGGTENHDCEQNEDYRKFRQTATEKGFQECPTCASTVELAEACNHITCECGAQFCYVCGEEWKGMHGCPHYGPATYDKEGYNQDGFHRSTGLNREGRTRREQTRIDHDDDGDSDEDHDEAIDEDVDEFHPVLQFVEPGVRAAFTALAHDEREMFLINLQIQLFEERGITFADLEESDREDDGDSDGEDDNVGEGNGIEAGDAQRNDNDGAQASNAIENGPTHGSLVQDALEEALDAVMAEAMQADPVGIDQGEHSESSSTSSADEVQPWIPMDVDLVEKEDGEQEREDWMGPPGGWPDDEML